MNILNGDFAAGSFEEAFHLPLEETLVFRDVLSCGPLQHFVNMTRWMNIRGNYWNSILAEQSSDPVSFHDMPRDFYVNCEELRSADEIKLWMGCALSDHLVLVFLVFLLDLLEVDSNKLSIIQFIKLNEGKPLIRGLGELRPSQIKQHPDPFELSTIQAEDCGRVWDVITNHSPEKYMNLINSGSLSILTLPKPLKAFYYRYPKVSNGLSVWDELLLKNTREHAPSAVKVIGYTMGECYEPDSSIELDTVGDIYLFHRLKNLARQQLNKPLLHMNSIDLSMRETEVEISEFGLKVLDGQQNVVEINGINDWVGGIHLDSSLDGTWFRNGMNLQYKSII